jgi:ribosomal small subunit protein bTHX
MGRGDKKSKKGKRWKGSFGVSRSKNAIKARLKRTASIKKTAAASEEAVAAKPKKTAKKKAEA